MLVDTYFIGDCLVCNQGLLLLRTTSRKKQIICICDECESIWTNLQKLDMDTLMPELLDSSGYSQIIQDFVFGDDSHWSSECEIIEKNLILQIKGIVKTPKQ